MWLLKFSYDTQQLLFKTKEEMFKFMDMNKYPAYSIQYIKVYEEENQNDSQSLH